ncbi:MAG: SGNH/GDSL hydrolase family protein [Schwartzia sp.]|nr:SGNH/GDSL hydrolase family protein [Schwartzia sp. (in: firmicutes)]
MGQTMQPLPLTEEMKKSRLYRLLQNAETVCFVGDSLTEGTINGGVPWYEPIRPSIPGKIFNISQGGATTKILLDYFLPSIVSASADLYIVAAGANDILFREPLFCAVTAKDYTRNLQKLRDAVCERRPDAKFIFIAPWLSTDGDAGIIGGEKPPDTDAAYRDYTAALAAWCKETGDEFIDANDFIARQFAKSSPETYLIDFIHPTADLGVRLYAEAVLMSGAL